jgi:multidrug efflux pump subunit AcrB
VTFQVIKASDANTVKVADAVKAGLRKLRPSLPAGYGTSVLIDQSSFIKENAHEVELAIVFGGAAAILVILIFMLDLRSTFISALALPTSVLGTFLMMYALGFTLNMMTLLGLSLAIGLLIDDAVVVRENIFRHLEMGEAPAEAAARGTREITLAVLATTFTIVAVFVPVAFMKGIVGQFFRQFGLTVTAAVLLSMLVAFTLDPMLSARLAVRVTKGAGSRTGVRERVAGVFERAFRALDRVYAAALRWALAHPKSVVAIALALFASSLGMAKSIGSDFMASEDRGQFLLELQFPAQTSLAETSRRSLAVERKLTQDGRFKTVYATLGSDGEVNKVRYRIDAGPKTERAEGLEKLKSIARSMAETAPGASVIAEDPPIIEGLGTWRPIMISIAGPSYDVLEPTASRVAEVLRRTPGATDVKIDFQPGKGEMRIVPDRGLAGAAGLPVALIGMNARIAMEGEVAGQVRTKDTRGDDKQTDIRVRLAPEHRGSARSIGRIPLAVQPLGATRPGTVRLEDVAKLDPGVGPARINRESRSRRIVVSAAVSGRPMGDVVADLRPRVTGLIPAGYQVEWLGMIKDMEDSNASFGLAFALAVLFIYVVLASQFESFVHPATIMLSLPLALIGAIAGLWANRYSLAMGSQIGIMLLMGLVTKNAILLVDSALGLQREGMSAKEALTKAGPRRLQPILMTSAAMVLGTLPTALSRGSGSEFRAPMSIAVIGGVISSTLLTLLVVPVVYLGVDWVRGLAGRPWQTEPRAGGRFFSASIWGGCSSLTSTGACAG